METTIQKLELALNSFNPSVRKEAVDQLADLLFHNQIPVKPEEPVINLHCHTFFSFNAYGYSPSGLVWLAKKNGFRQIGIVDFDVLDGVDEFFAACDKLSVRGTTGLETRVYIPQFFDREINSPGEPGIFYYMGIGFTSSQSPTDVLSILDSMRERAYQRNREIIARVNPFLSPIAIDYERDVLPLTPAKNATERHILVAYLQASSKLGDEEISFWATKLQIDPEQIAKEKKDPVGFQNLLRSKLMKKGGIGYIQPDSASFPEPREVNQLFIACEAIPCATWLDGTSIGEQAMSELLELLIADGVAALNIIPDRNWNIKDPETRKKKVENLYQIVELATKLDLPIIVGTEMNSFGQKIVDDFTSPELAPLVPKFLDGANLIYGHTMMQRGCKMGYQSEWAKLNFISRHDKNQFYQMIGSKIQPGINGLNQLSKVQPDFSPRKIINLIDQ